MSKLSDFLSIQLKDQGISAKEMARRMDISASLLSLFLSGRRTSCEVSTLVKMCNGISSRPDIRSGLFEAMLSEHAGHESIPVDFLRSQKLPSLTKKLLAEICSGEVHPDILDAFYRIASHVLKKK